MDLTFKKTVNDKKFFLGFENVKTLFRISKIAYLDLFGLHLTGQILCGIGGKEDP